MRSQVGVQIRKGLFVYLRGFGKLSFRFEHIVKTIGIDGYFIQKMIAGEVQVKRNDIYLIIIDQLL